MRFTRLVTMLISVALLGLPAFVLTAAPASAVETWATRVLIDRAPAKQLYGEGIRVSGLLQAQRPADGMWLTVDGQTLQLEQRSAGSDTWAETGTQLTNASGEVEFSLSARSNSTLRIVYDGGSYDETLSLHPSESAERASKVMRDLQAEDLKKNNRIYLKGNVNPGWGGKTITLQRKTCKSCAWKVYDKQRTGDNGSWRFHTPAPRRGSWYFRAKVAGTTEFVTSYSGRLRTWTERY